MAPERSIEDLLPENTLKTRVPQERVERVTRPAPSRYRNEIAKYMVHRSQDCRRCGKCAEVCSYQVHVRNPGYKYFGEPLHHLCIGPACEKTGHYCVALCPQGALQVRENPMCQALGDCRWSSDLILATWRMAETGEVPPADYDYDYECGRSGGGFDRLRFKFPARPPVALRPEQIDTSLLLNKRDDGRPKLTIDVPWYGGGMSFGSVSNVTQLSKARAAVAFNTFTCTGEGGYMERMRPYDDHVITQVATGLFGVREETIQRVPIVEFKYAQGAKPGLGGHLLGDKVTSSVATMRESLPWISLFSPFPFHSVYSVEDHKKHVDWIKTINPKALVSVKVSTPTDIDMVAVGSYYAGAHIVHIDGSYGGTGAAPEIAKKTIAMPIEFAIPKVHRYLSQEGVRQEIVVMASGGIRTAYDVAKAIALGADGAILGTTELVALGCTRCSNCERGRGCPFGLTTTDPELSQLVEIDWGAERLSNLYRSFQLQLADLLRRLGLTAIRDLVGRTDLLIYRGHAGVR